MTLAFTLATRWFRRSLVKLPKPFDKLTGLPSGIDTTYLSLSISCTSFMVNSSILCTSVTFTFCKLLHFFDEHNIHSWPTIEDNLK